MQTHREAEPSVRCLSVAQENEDRIECGRSETKRSARETQGADDGDGDQLTDRWFCVGRWRKRCKV